MEEAKMRTGTIFNLGGKAVAGLGTDVDSESGCEKPLDTSRVILRNTLQILLGTEYLPEVPYVLGRDAQKLLSAVTDQVLSDYSEPENASAAAARWQKVRELLSQAVEGVVDAGTLYRFEIQHDDVSKRSKNCLIETAKLFWQDHETWNNMSWIEQQGWKLQSWVGPTEGAFTETLPGGGTKTTEEVGDEVVETTVVPDTTVPGGKRVTVVRSASTSMSTSTKLLVGAALIGGLYWLYKSR